MTRLAGEREVVLESYGGATQRCGLVEPACADELAALLVAARDRGRRITFRGGGCAFDTQALNPDLVISLGALDDVCVPTADRLRAGAGATWGTVVDVARAHQRMPAVVVTTHRTTVAGTASGNCVSRWSALHGQDGDHVQRIELVTVDGERRVLERPTGTAHDDVFFGVTGGLGYLGAITRVDLKLVPCAHDQVASEVVHAGDVRDVIAAIAPGSARPPDATAYAVLMPDLRRGLAFRAHYTSGEPLRRYKPVHQPRSVLRLAGELLLRTHTGSRLIWRAGYRKRGRYVDPILDYTFFMEGNVRARRFGRRLGFAMTLVQQSFVLPGDALAAFLEHARGVFAAQRVVPMLADVLFCPADEGLLSATHQLAGFFVTFAFAPITARRHARAKQVFVELSRRCGELGGRVHLTKNVHAEPEVLAEMYAATLPRFRQVKQALDPHGLIRNPFLERTFPSLVCR